MESEGDNGDQSDQSAEGSESQAGRRLSRRDLGRGAAVLFGFGLAGVGYLWYGSQPSLALEDTDNWIASSASITSADGSVDSLTFGDPEEITDSAELEDDDNRVTVSWEGFDSGSRAANFTISLAGTAGGDGGSWSGDGETTSQEEMATGDATLEGTSGAEAFTWNDVFGESQPVDVAAHSEIELSDFEAEGNDATTVRELEVIIEVVVPDQDGITASKSALATITVTNQEATLEVGGQGSFELESDEEVTPTPSE